MAKSIEYVLKRWMVTNRSGNQPAWQHSDIVKLDIEALPQIEILLQNSGLPPEDCCYHINHLIAGLTVLSLVGLMVIHLTEKRALRVPVRAYEATD